MTHLVHHQTMHVILANIIPHPVAACRVVVVAVVMVVVVVAVLMVKKKTEVKY